MSIQQNINQTLSNLGTLGAIAGRDILKIQSDTKRLQAERAQKQAFAKENVARLEKEYAALDRPITKGPKRQEHQTRIPKYEALLSAGEALEKEYIKAAKLMPDQGYFSKLQNLNIEKAEYSAGLTKSKESEKIRKEKSEEKAIEAKKQAQEQRLLKTKLLIGTPAEYLLYKEDNK